MEIVLLFLIIPYVLSAYLGWATILKKDTGSFISGFLVCALVMFSFKLRETDISFFKHLFLESSNWLLISIAGGIISGALCGWSHLKNEKEDSGV